VESVYDKMTVSALEFSLRVGLDPGPRPLPGSCTVAAKCQPVVSLQLEFAKVEQDAHFVFLSLSVC
jgi:hypothetical protein